MTSKKTTRSALFMSIIALMLCMSMLVGTTFAWFTDEVISGRNVIAAGNLDVELYANGDPVNSGTVLFDGVDPELWEPGAVAYENLQISNVGTLALKCYLELTVLNETVVDGYKLGDAIMVGTTDAPIATGADRNDVIASVTNWAPLSGYTFRNGGIGLEAGESTNEFGVVLYWQPKGNEYDNRFNMNNERQGEVLQLDVGVRLFATQLELEEDSFGDDYDGGAEWVTATSIDWYLEDPTATEFVLTSGEDLAGLSAIVGGTATADMVTYAATPATIQDNFAGKTIKLGNDIDLGNHPFAPITNGTGKAFAGTFDGQGYTISNLKIKSATSAGFFGNLCSSAVIKNVTFDTATVSGTHYVGVILAGEWNEKANATIDNCHVINAKVYCDTDATPDNGDKAGVIAGYAVSLNITNCSVKDSAIKAYRDFGGILGCSNGANNTISGNTVENLTLTIDNDENYNNISSVAGHNANAIVGRVNKGNISGNTESGIVVVPMAANTAGLKDAISNATAGSTVVVGSGEFSLPTLSGKEGIIIEGAADGSSVIGGDDVVTGFGGNWGKDTTIKNLTFTGSDDGVWYSYAQGGNTTFEDCAFAGDSVYGFHIDQSNSAVFTFNNCTFSGFNAFAGDLQKVVFNNCTFLHNGAYGHTNIWSVGEFNNCSYGDGASIGIRGSGKIYVDGVEESYHHEFVGSAASLYAFADSVNAGGDAWAGQKVVLCADIDLKNEAWTPIGQTGATQFQGIFDGNGYTISNLKIDSSAQTGGYYSSGLFGWLNNAAVQNVTVENATVIGNHNVGVIAGYLETSGCTVSGCKVINATVEGHHANDEACGDKVGVIVGHAGNAGVKVENCSATDCTVSAGRDAGQIVGAALTANVTGCSATNVTVTANGECNGSNVTEAVIGRVLG